ncbi:LPS assembly protein LptD [Alisedimentitalea sp. MJ-SS2]|uniref:LPS-assembly protein LptD n=1 Tax=Aliisedimentitalea sp. MJ-SS2 TaxID=3049795 RepID=UPI00290BB366|nr:LPS assembly protein LptD [Alisedimentitalea sp. MJ-SS2]MDU8926561.1 LPS assembly protein LptD [Alisedimentitalea sp. MJ-SS2]
MTRVFLALVVPFWTITVALICVLLLASPGAAQTQTPTPPPSGAAVLVADQVFLQGKTTLVATGNVEALHGDTRIKARRITYDRTADQLVIEGPITIQQGQDVLVLANQAQMDPQFHNALLTGARMVLNQQVQLAAHQLNRVNGRYTQMYKASVTACRVCNDNRPPLWQIRARKVIHDQVERQLYFEDAQLRVLDVPIFYLPRLRLPDPTLDRATGFLIPKLRGNSDLGTGIKIPYFIRLGDHRDLTITPYLSPNTKTLELRYRQAFRTGRITFEGAISDDDLTTDEYRGYIFGWGLFDLKRGFKLSFDLELATDKSYLLAYDFSDKDRLDSEIAVTRVRRDEYIRAALTHYHTLRVNESQSTMPSVIGDFTYERRFFPRFGGEFRVSAGAHSHFRSSSLGVDGPDVDPISGAVVDGRDVTQLEAQALWLNTWTVGPGLRLGFQAGVAIDSFYTGDDITRPASATQVTPMAAISLRWPWSRITPGGATHIVEPMVQLAWSGGSNSNVANDESTRVEFDEGNLMSLSRFPATDRRERGLVTAYGVSWTRYGPKGLQSSLTFGQVTRTTADNNFTATSGLRGTTSDLLVAGQMHSQNGLSLTARALFDAQFDLAKGEARAGWQSPKLAVGASYVWLGADPAEDRASTVSEWSVDGLYRLSRHWTGSANVRYDVVSKTAAEAGMGLQYRNECVEIDLSVSRRFTSSVILTPSTDFSVTVGLKGFSAKTRDKSYTRKCGF